MQLYIFTDSDSLELNTPRPGFKFMSSSLQIEHPINAIL